MAYGWIIVGIIVAWLIVSQIIAWMIVPKTEMDREGAVVNMWMGVFLFPILMVLVALSFAEMKLLNKRKSNSSKDIRDYL